MPTITDLIEPVKVQDGAEFVLTVFFNGGPINVTVLEKDIPSGGEAPESPTRVFNFTADPFFRKPDHYIATGSVVVRFPPAVVRPKRVTIAVLFTNMFSPSDRPGPAHFRLQLTSPASSTQPRPVDLDGTVDPDGTQNVVILITT
jgi:hypothetical protein